jgi:hypothetical protein
MNSPTTTKPKKKQIPQFSSYEQEAHFWETHAVTDYWENPQPNQIKLAEDFSVLYAGEDEALSDKEPLQGIHLRLPASVIKKLKHQAKRRSIGTSTLAGMMLLDSMRRFNQEPKSPQLP